MKCGTKYLLMGLIVLAAGSVHAEESPRQNGPIRGIFYQPWHEDLSLTKSDWNQRMARLQRDGVGTLYIQWLRHGKTDFLHAHIQSGEPFLQAVLDCAAIRGIRVFIGLYSDPAYFQSLLLSTAGLDSYLDRLRQKSLETARAFQARHGEHPAFCGWYLPEEIDDANWRTDARKKMLKAHIRLTEADLKRLDQGKPIALSTFFSGAVTPGAYAQFCQQLMDGTDHLLLVQDGLGTGRIPLSETLAYHKALTATIRKNDRLYWVVELFNDELPGPGFSGKALSPDQLHDRLTIIHHDFRKDRVIAFSLRYWIEKDALISEHYRKHFHGVSTKEPARGPAEPGTGTQAPSPQ